MKTTTTVVLSLLALLSQRAWSQEPIDLWMPDGQLLSNPVRVYVTARVALSMNPTLRLAGGHALTTADPAELNAIKPSFVALDQSWQQPGPDGSLVMKKGTLMLFDLSRYPVPRFKAMMRLTPLLQWGDADAARVAIGGRAVNLGNSTTAWTMSAGVMLLTLLLLLVLLKGDLGGLLLGDDQRLSLSHFQIALWTVAVGTIVFGHGLIQLDVPAIPESTISLLGLSLVTGGVSYLRTNRPSIPASGWRLRDLVCEGDVPSISRAQMLLWTILMVILFGAKSILNGVVWEVPWSMVALMGLSHGSYLAPKFAPSRGSAEATSKESEKHT